MVFDKKALIEATQELVRVAFFAAVSAVVALLLQKLQLMDQNQNVVLLGTLALKWLDKYIHDNKDIKLNGLTDTRLIGM